MTTEEIEAQRKDNEARIASAWMELSLVKEFRVVFERDLQKHFGMFEAAFRSEDGYNANAAAKRDGHKEVLNFIARRLARGTAMLDADEAVIQSKEAMSEYQGTPP